MLMEITDMWHAKSVLGSLGLRSVIRDEPITDENERREAEHAGLPPTVAVTHYYDGNQLVAVLYPENGWAYRGDIISALHRS